MNEKQNKIKYFKEVEKVEPEVYYHYTSLGALYEIVKSKTFRMSYLRYTNDKKELFYNGDTFLCDLEQLAKAEKSDATKKFYTLLVKETEKKRNEFDKEVNDIENPYALCLSCKGDNLTHWDRYADRAQGVSIGINVKAFSIMYQRMGSDYSADHLLEMGRVLYDEEDIREYIKRESVNYLRLAQEKTERGAAIKHFFENNLFVIPTVICQHLISFSKEHSFVDEDEYRIYHDSSSINRTNKMIDSMAEGIDNDLYKNMKKHFAKTVKSMKLKREYAYTKDRGIIEFTDLCLGQIWGTGSIPEVIIGPLCRVDRNTLRRFLSQNGLEGITVKKSKVPLR